MNLVPSDCFIVDATPIYPSTLFALEHSCLYDQFHSAVIGDERDESRASPEKDLRLCFNCGSPDHAVASCPEAIDRQLVSLSRQLFNFLYPELTGQETTRFYIAEGWKQQRLQWLDSFEPGVIRGRLRDALGLQDGDRGDTVEWLRNMAYWGYPPGWVAHRDPRKLVCARILDDGDERQCTPVDREVFTIFEGANDEEEIDLALCSLGCSSTLSRTASPSVGSVPVRWATYPNTYFSTTSLSVYDGTPLGRVDSSPPRVSATFTSDRRLLWESILSGELSPTNPPSVPPWRLPGALGASALNKELAPPLPSTAPPPLPPSPIPPSPTFMAQDDSMLNGVSTPSSPSGTDDVSVVDMTCPMTRINDGHFITAILLGRLNKGNAIS